MIAGDGIILSEDTISVTHNEKFAVKMLAGLHGSTHYAICNDYIALMTELDNLDYKKWRIYIMVRGCGRYDKNVTTLPKNNNGNYLSVETNTPTHGRVFNI